MRLLFILSVLTGMNCTLNAQNVGLFGKQNFIEINATGYAPVVNWIFHTGLMYKSTGKKLTETKDLFNYSFNVNIGRAYKRNRAFSLELGYQFSNIPGPEYTTISYTDQWGYTYDQYVYLLHEMLDIRTISVMPKLEFTQKGGLLPIGLNHQIGFGFNSTKIVEKDYNYYITYGAQYLTAADSADLDQNMINYSKKYSGFTLLYAFNIRTPISKRVMINYGIRYTLNLRNYMQSFPTNSNYWYEESTLTRQIGRVRGTNFISFNLGITYAF